MDVSLFSRMKVILVPKRRTKNGTEGSCWWKQCLWCFLRQETVGHSFRSSLTNKNLICSFLNMNDRRFVPSQLKQQKDSNSRPGITQNNNPTDFQKVGATRLTADWWPNSARSSSLRTHHGHVMPDSPAHTLGKLFYDRIMAVRHTQTIQQWQSSCTS